MLFSISEIHRLGTRSLQISSLSISLVFLYAPIGDLTIFIGMALRVAHHLLKTSGIPRRGSLMLGNLILGIDILGKLILGIENEIFKKRFIVSNIVSLQFTKEESFLLQ